MKRPWPSAVLDVVAEDPQVPHVADDVRPAAVQEHRRDERRRAEARPARRRRAVRKSVQRALVGMRQLEQPRQRVEDDDRDGDGRNRAGRDDVPERESFRSVLRIEDCGLQIYCGFNPRSICNPRSSICNSLDSVSVADRFDVRDAHQMRRADALACGRDRRCAAGRRRRSPCDARRAR